MRIDEMVYDDEKVYEAKVDEGEILRTSGRNKCVGKYCTSK